jgi:uncharacterized protein
MNRNKLIDEIIKFVKEKLAGDSSGHDWWHIYRVWNLARNIQKAEGGDLFVIELSALLHDVADWKFYENEQEGLNIVRTFLENQDVEIEIINSVISIIENVSFKGAGVKDRMTTIEGKIVQDADRLDAIGAIGVARTFAFGGKYGNEMHNPDSEIIMHNNFEQYKKSNGTTINHFHEKLLLLKDRMNTVTAKKMANLRHKYMEQFLNQFMNEWDGIN